ncbi:hypothetical protein VTK73DRAFT_9287 [Phialemonium thermophilum]|uniref:Major facilitator superfamily transporter n=1 Tax=Phialemonium thermophilum TaxID=223376 RepID=A0ABR3W3U2_9PEZI
MFKFPARRLVSRPLRFRGPAYLTCIAFVVFYFVLLCTRTAGNHLPSWRGLGFGLSGWRGGIGSWNHGENRDARLRRQFQLEYDKLGRKPGANAVYGATLATLVDKDARKPEQEKVLSLADDHAKTVAFSFDRPFRFNPYPKYNDADWAASHAQYVPCVGPTGAQVQDISVFKGRPRDFPSPGFGSYGVLDLDPNICYERETRLGPYGFTYQLDSDNRLIDWEKVDWGTLQDSCVKRNKARFDLAGAPNEFLSVYQRDGESASQPLAHQVAGVAGEPHRQPEKRSVEEGAAAGGSQQGVKPEPRTAVLLRSYTGKQYNDNDKQVIRALITELSLRTGGEYEVFLLVHVKQPYDIFGDEETYRYVVETEVPREFWNITILWNDDAVHRMYPALDPSKEATVHNAQWLSVQKFMQEHRQFDYVWNWEMDSRATGHHYDILSKLAGFAKKQPRKGLWERNERFYIPSVHGDYDTEFRKSVAAIYGDDSVWGPPPLPFIRPIGPQPPVRSPREDNYEWGVGEEADLITLSPLFNPVNSNWILRNQVWGYQDAQHPPEALPRRATIITQSRVSRRLLDIMHVENLRGNHVGSEMTPQTVALLHGLKAVYAPMPVFFDRPWTGRQLTKWFNGGPKGESGGFGSAMGWGREGRFTGSTWYFRADPPQRMYNNWMGYEDTGIGGLEWEATYGRPCLPAMLLHPVKDVHPTKPGHSSKSRLPYR